MKNLSYRLSLVLCCIVALFLLAACGITSASVTPQISGGGYHSLSLKSDGTVWAWGYNKYGQLGDGTTTERITPVQVSSLSGVIAIAGGHQDDLAILGEGKNSLALKSDGTVWAWGYNGGGQLGDGTTTDRKTPVQVSSLSGVIAVTGGGGHSLALKSDGTVWAWGYNEYGQLGNAPSDPFSITPGQVSSLSGFIAVAAGGGHSLALKSDGTVWAWGYNKYGQLGDGATTDSITPGQVSSLSGVIAVAGGWRHSLALKSDGTVWAWGYNWSGQLGDGTTTDRKTPVQVSSLSGVIAVTGGGGYSLALKSDGTVWAWGHNWSGQLGDGTTTDRKTPVQVSGLNLGVTTSTPTPVPSPTSSLSNIFGFVYDSEEEPIKDVTVTIKGDNYSGSTATDEYGYYELKNLYSGDYTLTYSKEGYQTKTQDVTLGENENQDLGILTLESVEKGSITGYVVDFRGYEIDSATIRMKGLNTGYSKTISSDTDGYFEFTDLEADTYILTAKKSGYKQGKRTVKLSEGEAREVELKMKRRKKTSVQSQF